MIHAVAEIMMQQVIPFKTTKRNFDRTDIKKKRLIITKHAIQPANKTSSLKLHSNWIAIPDINGMTSLIHGTFFQNGI